MRNLLIVLLPRFLRNNSVTVTLIKKLKLPIAKMVLRILYRDRETLLLVYHMKNSTEYRKIQL